MNRFNKSIRRMRFLYKKGGLLKGLAFLIYRWNRVVYSCDIPPQAVTENATFMHKGFGIVISPYVVIGKNTSIQHGVTLGILKTDKEAPVIGDNCFIGAKATVLGNVHIGNNAKIGANALVLTDVPDNATAIGVPAKIIREG